MIYSVNYIDMAGKINPLAFARYLKDTGWMNYPTKRTYLRIFQWKRNDSFYQVTIPADKKLSDYNEAMYKAVQTVAEVENKSIEQVMLYLMNPNTDILKIRLEKNNIEAGNILLDDAIRIYENTKKLLSATAQDIINPKISHKGRPEEAVQKFLSDCRFGQTEIGSYVISVVCPFAELDQTQGYKQLSIFSDEEQCANSLTRQITNRVIRNISTIKQSIDDDNIDNLLVNNENTLISTNFYEALNGLNLESEGAEIEFNVEWSPVVKNAEYENVSISLSHDYYQPIGDVLQRLQQEINQSTTGRQ